MTSSVKWKNPEEADTHSTTWKPPCLHIKTELLFFFKEISFLSPTAVGNAELLIRFRYFGWCLNRCWHQQVARLYFHSQNARGLCERWDCWDCSRRRSRRGKEKMECEAFRFNKTREKREEKSKINSWCHQILFFCLYVWQDQKHSDTFMNK